jgi:serine/threonine protein kinase
MNYVEGCSIEQLFALDNTPIPLPVTLGIVREVALALEHLHGLKGKDGKQLVRAHRDVTPRNVLIRRDGTAVLIDFGLVTGAVAGRQTATNVVKGTWRYAAPEQLLGREVGPSVDIYGLGALLYRMVTGTRPLDHVRELDDMRRAKEATALRPECMDDEVSDLIESMTQPKKDLRIQSATEVVVRLDELGVANRSEIMTVLGNSVEMALRIEEEKARKAQAFTSAEERNEDVTDPSTTSDITRTEDMGGLDPDELPEPWVIWVSVFALLASMAAIFL